MHYYLTYALRQGLSDHQEELDFVTFLINQTVQCVNINITDDDEEEDIESFEIYIGYVDNIHGYPKLEYYNASEAIITIYDDDCKLLSLLLYTNCSFLTCSNL